MKYQILKNVLCCLAAISMSQIVWAASIVKYEKRQPTQQHSISNSIIVQCYVSEGIVKKSRAVVLHINEENSLSSQHDIAVTTGHGFIDNDGKTFNKCEVIGPSRKTYPIKTIKFAPNYKPGTASDWAVMSLPKMETEKIQRYSVVDDKTGQEMELLARQNMPVLFSTARAYPQNGQSCILYPRKYAGFTKQEHKGLLAHNCRAISGQSGSPVSVERDGHPILIGIHIGNSFVLKVQDVDQPPRFYGYMRVIDRAVLEAQINLLINSEVPALP